MSAASLAQARARRTECRQDSALFGRLLADLGLTLATDRTAYWAHWITPEERPIRYDTRFFVAPAWPGQVPEPDGVEMVAARWMRPEEALASHRERALVLPLPTKGILTSLAGHRDADRYHYAYGYGDARAGGPARAAAHRQGRRRRAGPASARPRLVLRPARDNAFK